MSFKLAIVDGSRPLNYRDRTRIIERSYPDLPLDNDLEVLTGSIEIASTLRFEKLKQEYIQEESLRLKRLVDEVGIVYHDSYDQGYWIAKKIDVFSENYKLSTIPKELLYYCTKYGKCKSKKEFKHKLKEEVVMNVIEIFIRRKRNGI